MFRGETPKHVQSSQVLGLDPKESPGSGPTPYYLGL